jgi:hypothetical protein
MGFGVCSHSARGPDRARSMPPPQNPRQECSEGAEAARQESLSALRGEVERLKVWASERRPRGHAPGQPPQLGPVP